MKTKFLPLVRQQNPLVHNITNIVAANFSANGLLAIGASPIMSASLEEMVEVPKLSQAVVINIGTLPGKQIEAMVLAGKTANEIGIPVVLDPVGVAATTQRQKTVEALLNEVKFTAIRGNAGELAYLAGVAWKAKGVDVGSGESNLAEIAHQVARQYDCIAVISGETDFISDGSHLAKLNNGTPMFPKVTASGCLLSAVCGAFLAVAEPENYFDALVEGCSAYAIAGEIAAQSLRENQLGQFSVGLLDQLAALSSTQVEQLARISYE